ncbi:DNA repair exonuclease [Bacillaceae bacterium Marseille-Q3522]|nr:DNA repair exonuclease [Bacillaceae bacterium Marseille-Q3522]
MKEITFIHGADLHLDSPMAGLTHLPPSVFKRVRESTFTALTNLTNLAIEKKVDFVLLAGDLYDEENRSVRAQFRLKQEMERLAKHQIAVYLIHGNHDHLQGTWAHLDMPENVQIFAEEVEKKLFQKNGVITNIYGFSYKERHIFARKIDDYNRKGEADFHIGLLHGYLEGAGDHGKYAPFRVSDLMEKHFDYWALGHIHKREILSERPPIVYSGNTQGRSLKETGRKGCYYVRLNEAGCELTFSETADIIWLEHAIDAGNATSFQDVLLLCQKTIKELHNHKQAIFAALTINNVSLPKQDMEILRNGELIGILQEAEQYERDFVWPVQIKVNQQIQWDKDVLRRESEFYDVLFNVAAQTDHFTKISGMLEQQLAARHLFDPLSEEEKQMLVQESEQLLLRLLQEK